MSAAMTRRSSWPAAAPAQSTRRGARGRPLATTGPGQQHGRLLLAAAVSIMAVAATTLSAWVGARSQAAQASLAREQRDWLEQARVQLERWYRQELALVDARPEAVAAQRVVHEAGVVLRWGARLEVGERVEHGESAGRILRLRIPSGSAPDPHGQLEVGVSGLALQTAAVGRAREGLERLARDFELGYRARYHADPSRDVSVNRFRARECLRPRPAEWPCLDDWTPLAAVVVPDTVDARALTDPWGGSVLARNDPLPSAAESHALRLRVITPWGRALDVVAVPAL